MEENRKDKKEEEVKEESLYVRGKEIEWAARLLKENKDAWMSQLADNLHEYEFKDELPASIGGFIEENKNIITALLLEDLYGRKIPQRELKEPSIKKYKEFFKKNAVKLLNLGKGRIIFYGSRGDSSEEITLSPSEVDTKFEDGKDHSITVRHFLKMVFLMADAPLDVSMRRISWLNGQKKTYLTVYWSFNPRYTPSHQKHISEEDKLEMRIWMDANYPGMRLEKLNEKAWKVYSSMPKEWDEEEGELMTFEEALNYAKELNAKENEGKEDFESKDYIVERPESRGFL